MESTVIWQTSRNRRKSFWKNAQEYVQSSRRTVCPTPSRESNGNTGEVKQKKGYPRQNRACTLATIKQGRDRTRFPSFLALKTSIAFKRGVPLSRWARGLSVIREKMFGCSLVNRLRAILLMEADFNTANKIIFGKRMMDVIREYGLMPDEIYSEQGKMADDGSLAKILFYDIVRQSQVSAAIASIDAANCYDSIAHTVVSMVFDAFGVSTTAIETMLATIQNMKYFLRTAYGDSNEYAGSTISIKFQGLCQGNGAAPAGWGCISITIVGAHKRKGHGGYFICSISTTTCKLAAINFVDDTDLIHIRMDKDETSLEAHVALQE